MGYSALTAMIDRPGTPGGRSVPSERTQKDGVDVEGTLELHEATEV